MEYFLQYNFQQKHFSILILFFPMFPFDPPENIRKPSVGSKGGSKGSIGKKRFKHIQLFYEKNNAYIAGADALA